MNALHCRKKFGKSRSNFGQSVCIRDCRCSIKIDKKFDWTAQLDEYEYKSMNSHK